jgi:Zn-dependent M28 family amino/carboxypeptidase
MKKNSLDSNLLIAPRVRCGLLALLCGAGLAALTATAGPASIGNRVNNTPAKLMEAVTPAGVLRHLDAFQAIADAHDGNRASGTTGYDASVQYVVDQVTEAGYDVTVQSFVFQNFTELSPAILEQVSPPPAGALDVHIMQMSGSGDVTAAVSSPAGILGCSPADFAGFPVGHIALIRRGACAFHDKAVNAFNAGAAGVIVYNNSPGELHGRLYEDFAFDISVTGVTLALGEELAATPGVILRLKTDTFRGPATAANVIAESRTGNPDNVIMAGAHLDSVENGAGIQDNGSGSAAILEVALQMAKVKPVNKVRFAWWAAEEKGLIGSMDYVFNLTPAELGQINRYLNFDMIASPNHVYMIYDGDNSDAVGAPAGPEGSAQIEALFESYYTMRGLPFKGTDLDERSDYAPFLWFGIPVGGIFTGADGIKTDAEAALWGGIAGILHDPCYHQPCDTIENVNIEALDVNSDAIAYAMLHSAMAPKLGRFKSGLGKPNFDRVGSKWFK